MSKDITTVLQETAAKIFEELVFLFSFPADNAGFDQSAPFAVSMISFSGPFSGTLVMKLSDKMLPELAANMLGLEAQDELTIDDHFGSLTETLNIICGNFLPEIAGKKEVFDIDPPKVISEDDVLKSQNDQATTCRVVLKFEKGLCELKLFINSWMA